jgi:ribosomal protein S27AE
LSPGSLEPTMDMFTVALAILVGGIAVAIFTAVRMTRRQIDRRLQTIDPAHSDDLTRELASRVRQQADRIKCARCGGPTAMVLGTDVRYKCDVCHFEFDGPPHLP